MCVCSCRVSRTISLTSSSLVSAKPKQTGQVAAQFSGSADFQGKSAHLYGRKELVAVELLDSLINLMA